ncbi:MAG: hypothetical protein LRY41_03000 [Candidatus Pacebacteria bacterium]|nr:hypothetical protein [Candidatus Paceibacterota bacterium]
MHSKKRRTENQRVITFGFHEDADIAISNYAYISADGRPVGTRADLVWRNTAQSVEQTATLGKSFYYALAAAYAVYTDLFGAHPHLQDIVDTLVPPPGRLRVLEGVLDTVLIDDTYNSSPPALMHALDTLKELDTKGRKIAIIGDMLELGKFSDDAHRDAGIRAATFVDYLITVGPRAELCSQAALQHGLPQSIVFHAADADMALAHMLDIIEPADTILVKASQGVRLEKVSYGLLKDKERRHDLLVRQEKEWLDK